MPFFPDNLKKSLDERGVSHSQASKLGGISEKRLKQALEGTRVPTVTQIRKLTDRLAIPKYAFFYKSFEFPTPEIIDFRGAAPHPMKFGRNAKAIETYKGIRDFLRTLSIRLEKEPITPSVDASLETNPEQLAAAFRQAVRLSAFQYEGIGKEDFLKQFRDSIEKIGIFVIQDHRLTDEIDGFALYDETGLANTIVINSTARNAGARSFTLAHEVSHILGKRSAVTDNYQSDSDVETYCNRFAASLLIPREDFIAKCKEHELSFNSYKAAVSSSTKLARIFKCSVSAILIRAYALEQSNENFFFQFSRNIRNNKHPDAEKTKMDVKGMPPGVADRAYFGRKGVALISEAIERKVTTEFEIFSTLGLSKKRIDGIVKISNSGRKLSQ